MANSQHCNPYAALLQRVSMVAHDGLRINPRRSKKCQTRIPTRQDQRGHKQWVFNTKEADRGQTHQRQRIWQQAEFKTPSSRHRGLRWSGTARQPSCNLRALKRILCVTDHPRTSNDNLGKLYLVSYSLYRHSSTKVIFTGNGHAFWFKLRQYACDDFHVVNGVQ